MVSLKKGDKLTYRKEKKKRKTRFLKITFSIGKDRFENSNLLRALHANVNSINNNELVLNVIKISEHSISIIVFVVPLLLYIFHSG